MAQIKKDTSLRKAILQAAITGQLVSNVEGESLPLAPASKLSSATPSAGASPATPPETGKELLDKIIEERNNKLLAEWEEKQTDLFASNDAHSKNAKTVRSEQIRLSKKIKKPEPIVASEIDEDEIPFEIPENWCWCRLGDICYKITDGEHNTPRRTDSFSGYYLLSARNILNGSIQLEDVDYVDEEEYLKLAKRCNPIKNDVLLSCSGTVGRCSIVNDNNKYVMVRSAAMLSPVFVNSYFLMYSIQSGFLQKQIQDSSKQTAQANLFQGAIVKLLLPLPPLAVQNTIVAKLEQLLPLVDAYENALLQKEELKSALPDKVKKTILQEAITGKLTEAWRKSATIKESGKQLLDRIIEERNAKALAKWEEALKKNPKAKKPVPVIAREIEEDEIPFEVPESWCWVKGKNIFAQMESIKPQGETFTYIDTDAVNNKLNIIDNPKTLLVKEAPGRASRKLHKGDVLFSMVRPYLKNIAFVEDIFADAIASTGFYVMTQIGMYNPKFLYYMVLSPYVIDGLHYYMKGDNSPSINTTDVDNFVYPLPPLEEQEEIIKKVEELLPLCR